MDDVSMADLQRADRAAGVMANLEGNTPPSLHDRVEDSTDAREVLGAILLKLFDEPETLRGVTRNVTAGISELSGTPGTSEPVATNHSRTEELESRRGRIQSTRKRFEELTSNQSD